MTNEELIKEFSRWIDTSQKEVWYRDSNKWKSTKEPAWDKDNIYIVDDEYAETRKKLYDEQCREKQ